MKIHLAAVGESDLPALFAARAAGSRLHQMVDPESADLILLLGNFGREPQILMENPLYRAYPERCAVYTEDDNYLPLAPGIYCSAHRDAHARAGRIFSYSYLSRNGRYQNPYIPEDTSRLPPGEVQEKQYLFSFQGGSTSLLRKRMFNLNFKRPDVLIENTSTYYHWDDSQPDRQERQLTYARTMAASHFVLCPRGAGTGSVRFFEVMASGIAPVLLADNYQLPEGPAWESFLLRIPERDIARLPALLEPHLPSAAERGRLARQAFTEHFSVEREFDRVIELAARSLRHGKPSEEQFRRRQRAMIRRFMWNLKARGALRAGVLQTLKLLRLRNPYQMNR